MFAVLAQMNSDVPTGGVHRPIIRFRTSTTPRWTGSMPKEVISGIKLVSEACGNLLNRLYEDGIVDASTDISVLKMMLKQDGLLGSDFEK